MSGQFFHFSKLEALSRQLGKLQQTVSLRVSMVRFLRGHCNNVSYKVRLLLRHELFYITQWTNKAHLKFCSKPFQTQRRGTEIMKLKDEIFYYLPWIIHCQAQVHVHFRPIYGLFNSIDSFHSY